MKKILLPLEDTERSLKALHYAKKHYPPAEAEIMLLMVDERLGYSARSEVEEYALRQLDEKLELIAQMLEDYKVSKMSAVGKAGLRITRAAREAGADVIVMTKSSKADMLGSIGSTAEYVINNAPCDIVIVSEIASSRSEYRGLIYRTANGVVNLRGQLGDKQSECMLPSVKQDCVYRIEVTVGKVRFFHTAYNPDTRNWDLPPKPGQEVTMDIAAGETRNILVLADSTEGRADRIRLVNRDMRKEAVFTFNITAAELDEFGVPVNPEREAEMADIATRATMEVPRIEDESEADTKFEEPEVPDFMTELKRAEESDGPAAEEEPEAIAWQEPEPAAEEEPEAIAWQEPEPAAEEEPEAIAWQEPEPAAEEEPDAIAWQEPEPAAEEEPEAIAWQEPEPAAEEEPEAIAWHEPEPVSEEIPAAEDEPAPVKTIVVEEIKSAEPEPQHSEPAALFSVEIHE